MVDVANSSSLGIWTPWATLSMTRVEGISGETCSERKSSVVRKVCGKKTS